MQHTDEEGVRCVRLAGRNMGENATPKVDCTQKCGGRTVPMTEWQGEECGVLKSGWVEKEIAAIREAFQKYVDPYKR